MRKTAKTAGVYPAVLAQHVKKTGRFCRRSGKRTAIRLRPRHSASENRGRIYSGQANVPAMVSSIVREKPAARAHWAAWS